MVFTHWAIGCLGVGGGGSKKAGDLHVVAQDNLVLGHSLLDKALRCLQT